ncbi:non-heme iron oxygenase ferredoxin subunit [Leptolyngbya sp. 15MV]|nr:non-heme iron oxygenase ferredoxin subunit [Leptolyngbya sp. 15MV]
MSGRWETAAGMAALEAAGGVLGVNVAGRPIALFLVDGQVHATDDLCSHGAARLSDGYLDGHLIECPLHQGLFDVRDGRPAGPPCTAPIRRWPVRTEGGDVLIAIEE